MKADVAILPESSNKTLQSGIAGPRPILEPTPKRMVLKNITQKQIRIVQNCEKIIPVN